MGNLLGKRERLRVESRLQRSRPGSLLNFDGTVLTHRNTTGGTNSFKYYLAALVSLITFLVYLKSLQNQFVNWDDNWYVYENSFIHSLDTQLLKSAFTGFYAGNWHPLTWLSHAFDYAIWGLNPLGHHLTNNVLHALNTLIVVFLIMRLMEIFNRTAGDNRVSQPFLNDPTIRVTGQ
jgi:hypothetical protein